MVRNMLAAGTVRYAARRLVHAVLALALGAWATPTAVLPVELEPYFAAIQQVESRGHPWSIFDNTTRRSYRLASRAEAEATARELIQYGHNLDLGLMQLNCRYQCRREGISLDNIFDPQTNLRVARTVFLEFWDQARRVSTEFTSRVIAAVGAYNNGRVAVPNPGYVEKVWRQMGRPVAQIVPAAAGHPDGAVRADEPVGVGSRMSGLDDALGRAAAGTAWMKERLAAIAGGGRTDAAGADAEPEKKPDPTTSNRDMAEISMGLGLMAVFAVSSIGLFACIQLFGAMNVLRAAQLARSMSSRRSR